MCLLLLWRALLLLLGRGLLLLLSRGLLLRFLWPRRGILRGLRWDLCLLFG